MPPYYTEWRKASMGDLAAQTGGQVAVNGQLAADKPVTLDTIKLADLGRAKRVVVTQEKTTIVGGAGRKVDIDGRAREIRALYEATNSTVKHQELDDRLRRLVGGAALIKVGGTTDPETRERKLRVEDALFATRAAVAEGIVPGGGVALLRASEALKKVEKDVTPEQAAGVAIVRRACEVPLREIAENAGGARARRWSNASAAARADSATTRPRGELEDLMKAGVIDPTMVVRLALQNAASIATLMLTTEACIIEGPREIVDYPERGSGVDGFNTEPILSRRRR